MSYWSETARFAINYTNPEKTVHEAKFTVRLFQCLLNHMRNGASKASKKEDQSFIISGFAGLLTGTEKMEKSEQGEYERLD